MSNFKKLVSCFFLIASGYLLWNTDFRSKNGIEAPREEAVSVDSEAVENHDSDVSRSDPSRRVASLKENSKVTGKLTNPYWKNKFSDLENQSLYDSWSGIEGSDDYAKSQAYIENARVIFSQHLGADRADLVNIAINSLVRRGPQIVDQLLEKSQPSHDPLGSSIGGQALAEVGYLLASDPQLRDSKELQDIRHHYMEALNLGDTFFHESLGFDGEPRDVEMSTAGLKFAALNGMVALGDGTALSDLLRLRDQFPNYMAKDVERGIRQLQFELGVPAGARGDDLSSVEPVPERLNQLAKRPKPVIDPSLRPLLRVTRGEMRYEFGRYSNGVIRL